MLFTEKNERDDNLSLVEQLLSDTPSTDSKEYYHSDKISSDNNCLVEGVVFRKTPELLKCEKLLQEIIDNINSIDYGSNRSDLDAAANYEKYMEVERTLQEYFGFGRLFLSVPSIMIFPASYTLPKEYLEVLGDKAPLFVPDMSNIFFQNAFTVPADPINRISNLFSDVDDVLDKKNGRIRFKSWYRPVGTIAISAPLVSTQGMTGGEILAIILHEIGHNMYHGSIVARSTKVLNLARHFAMSMIYMAHMIIENTVLNLALKTSITRFFMNMGLSMLLMVGDLFNIMQFRVSERLSRTLGKDITDLANRFSLLLKIFNTIATVVMVGANFGRYINKYLLVFDTWARWVAMDGLSEEKFCDDFAAAHGYGPELASGLGRMQGVYEKEFDIKSEKYKGTNEEAQLGVFASTIESFLTMFAMLDVHPDINMRPFLMVEFMKSQLKNVRSKEEKAYIEDQIVKIIKASAVYKSKSPADKKKLLEKELEVIKLNPKEIRATDIKSSESSIAHTVGTLLSPISGYGMATLDSKLSD